MAGVAPQPGHRQSNSHIVALLSLKILLLAFFILLNAMSSFEDNRRSAVLDSVRKAFQGVLPAHSSVSDTPAAADILEGGETVMDALQRLFGDSLPLLERSESPGTATLKVDLPADDFFAEGGRALSPEGAETLRNIAAVLADARFAALSYRVDLLYGLRREDSGIAGHRPALARAGVLVRELERLGLAPDRLSAGFLPSFPDRLRIHFTVDVPAPPHGTAQDMGQ